MMLETQPQRVSRVLHESGASAWERATHHPMVRAIGDGSLPHEVFRGYFEQNVLYLQEYARAIALIVAKAPDRDAIVTLTRFLSQIVETRSRRTSGSSSVSAATARPSAIPGRCTRAPTRTPGICFRVRPGRLRRRVDGGASVSVELRRARAAAHGPSSRRSHLRGLDRPVRFRRVRRARRARRPHCSIAWPTSRTRSRCPCSPRSSNDRRDTRSRSGTWRTGARDRASGARTHKEIHACRQPASTRT